LWRSVQLDFFVLFFYILSLCRQFFCLVTNFVALFFFIYLFYYFFLKLQYTTSKINVHCILVFQLVQGCGPGALSAFDVHIFGHNPSETLEFICVVFCNVIPVPYQRSICTYSVTNYAFIVMHSFIQYFERIFRKRDPGGLSSFDVHIFGHESL